MCRKTKTVGEMLIDVGEGRRTEEIAMNPKAYRILNLEVLGEGTPQIAITPERLHAFGVAMVAVASGIDETGEEWNEMMEWGETYDEAVERFKKRAPDILAALCPGGTIHTARAVGRVKIRQPDMSEENEHTAVLVRSAKEYPEDDYPSMTDITHVTAAVLDWEKR